MVVERFRIEVPDGVLEDLRGRLGDTRWPDEIAGAGWDYGSNLDYVRELCEYWRTGFDWRAQERKLNEFHHYKSGVDGLDIHFIHERGQGPNPMPLVITHGWPSTFFEMSKIVPLLADPAAHGGTPRTLLMWWRRRCRGSGFRRRRRNGGWRLAGWPGCGRG